MEDLVVSVGADITGFLSKIDAAKAKVGQLTENQEGLKNVIKDLNTSLRLNEKELTNATVKLQKLNTSSKDGQTAAANLRKEIAVLATNSKVLSTELNVAKTSLANTTTQLKAATTNLKEAEKSTGGFGGAAQKAFSLLRNVANILPGVGIAGLLAFAIDPITKYVSKLFEAQGATKALEETQKAYEKTAVETATAVNDVRAAFELAKQGVISKKDALKEYNDKLGDALGHTNSLIEAEKIVAQKADIFIKVTGLKAQAMALFAEAAKETVRGLTADTKDQLSTFDKGLAGVKLFFGGYGDAATSALKAQVKGEEEVRKETAKTSKEIQKQGEELFKQAAVLAKAAGIKLEFSDPPKIEKAKKGLKEVEKIFRNIVHLANEPITIPEINVGNVAPLSSQQIQDMLSSADAAAKLAGARIAEKIRESFGENISAALNDMNAQIAEGIGQSIGDALSGKGDFAKELFGSIFQTLGNALQQLGKVAIQTGIGIKAIKAAFKTLNPIVAIAAGVSLIALGAIIKNSVGSVARFATGGFVSGPGGPKSDSIPARLSNGEYVMSASTVSRFGKSFFDMINGGGSPRNGGFADGGSVTGSIGGAQLITVQVVGRMRGKDIYFTNIRAGETIGRNG